MKTTTSTLIQKDKKYVWHPFTQMRDWEKGENLIITKGKGSKLKDTEGNWYLDGISSLWVNVHGHRKKEIDKAVQKQLRKCAHSTLLGQGNEASVLLAEKMIQLAPKGLKKVFFSDSGSTAVEIALKMAYQYWQQKENGRYKGKTKFIHLSNAYHGDTLGSVSVGGIDLFHEVYSPLLFKSLEAPSPHCYRCKLTRAGFRNGNLTVSGNMASVNPPAQKQCRWECVGKLEQILKKVAKKCAAVIVEPVMQGAAGMHISPPGYLKQVRQLCRRYNVLMIADEVATGFGRTGKMFACEHEKVTPDLMAVAKGISGGYLPLAATLTTQEIFNVFKGKYEEKKTFFHGHTYTGNPLACAAAVANLKLFEKENTLKKLSSKITYLEKKLKRFAQLESVGEIRQAGLMAGIELVENKKRKIPYSWEKQIGVRVCREALKRGVILRPLAHVIVLMPPLSITKKELKKLLDATFQSIRVICDKNQA